MPLRRRRSRPWSWSEVGERTLAVYQSERAGRLRTAVLVWQGDDPRVELAGSAPRLLALTMDVDPEPGEGNAVSLAGFDLLEAARAHCIDWAGDEVEERWDALAETVQIGLYASIREPGFADRAGG